MRACLSDILRDELTGHELSRCDNSVAMAPRTVSQNYACCLRLISRPQCRSVVASMTPTAPALVICCPARALIAAFLRLPAIACMVNAASTRCIDDAYTCDNGHMDETPGVGA